MYSDDVFVAAAKPNFQKLIRVGQCTAGKADDISGVFRQYLFGLLKAGPAVGNRGIMAVDDWQRIRAAGSRVVTEQTLFRKKLRQIRGRSVQYRDSCGTDRWLLRTSNRPPRAKIKNSSLRRRGEASSHVFDGVAAVDDVIGQIPAADGGHLQPLHERR